MLGSNMKYFCENCQKYINSRDEFFHKSECTGSRFRSSAAPAELERNEKTNYISKNERSDHYNLKEGIMTFGRTSNKVTDTFVFDKNNFNSTKSNYSSNPKEDTLESTYKRDNNKYDTFKNFNNDTADPFKNSNSGFRQTDYFSSSKQGFGEGLAQTNFQTTGSFLKKNNNQYLHGQNSIKEYEESDKFIREDRSKETKELRGCVGLSNKALDNNSFLNSVIQCLWNMKEFRNILLKEVVVKPGDHQFKFIAHLKDLFKNYSNALTTKSNEVLNVERLRSSIAELFQSRRKFLLEHTDDPVDCLFAIINSMHSMFIRNSPCEISEESCNFECVAHKLFWTDLFRLDECECGATSKKLFSYNNYILDIPFDKIFDITESPQNLELNKRIKLKTGKLNGEINNLNDFRGKLFNCLKNQLGLLRIGCPNGTCPSNQVNKTFTLSNSPAYFIINLQNRNIFNNPSLDILKSYVLIPGLFDISSFFECINQKKRVFYDFVGAITSNCSKSYSSFFHQKGEWVFCQDQYVVNYTSWYELVQENLKRQEMPILLIYQKQDSYSEVNTNLLNEDIIKLERYARNIESIPQILQNKFRPYEDLSKVETITSEVRVSSEHNRFKRQNNKQNETNVETYVCSLCNYRNRLENTLCIKCNKNNEIIINQVLSNTNRKNDNLPLSGPGERSIDKKVTDMRSTEQSFTKNLQGNESKSKQFYNKNENELAILTSERFNKVENREPAKSNETPQFNDEKNKTLNLPKQMPPNVKENNYLNDKPNDKTVDKVDKNQIKSTISSCKECGNSTDRCKCQRSNNLNSDKQLLKQPEEKYKKTNSNEWECENCKSMNSATLTRCKVCKYQNKSSLQQQSTAPNSKDANMNGLITKKTIEEKLTSKQPESTQTNNLSNNNGLMRPNNLNTAKDAINIAANSKCICYVIDNDSLYTNNQCRLCKRIRTEKVQKPQPKKVTNTATGNINDLRTSKEYQQIANQTSSTTNKPQITKSNSREHINGNDLKRLEVKKTQYESNDGRNSRGLNSIQKPNSSIKPSNFATNPNESSNPFKKTFITNPQVPNGVPSSSGGQGVGSYKRNPSKESELRNFNTNTLGANQGKGTLSKQRYGDLNAQRFK